MAYITPEEIAEELRVSVKAVYMWLRKGVVRGIKVGKVWRVRRADYDYFLDNHTNIPAPSHKGEKKRNGKGELPDT